jgi:hypothetical protein
MKRWLERLVVALAIAFVAVYGGDWAVFKLRGSPQAKVTVNHYMAIPLKGDKQEFDFLGTQDTPCVLALFPQAGMSPCWQLRRNPNQGMKI